MISPDRPRRRSGSRLLAASVLLLAAASPFHALARAGSGEAAVIRNVLSQPEDGIDLARAKLTFDRLVDPRIDVEASLGEIDRMEQGVRAMVKPDAPPLERLRAVRMYIYVAGAWNGYRPYAYDLSDPLGRRIENKLLPTYLATRRGNCVSMPFLFIILARRLGVHVTAATTPFHILAQYVDDASGKTYNLETTSGALPARDAYYRKAFPMTDAAIANGLYLRPLSVRQTAGLMAQVVIEHDVARARWQDVVAAADAVLAVDPKSVDALLNRGSAYGRLAEADLAAGRSADYRHAMEENRAAFARAEALGWREPGAATAVAQAR